MFQVRLELVPCSGGVVAGQWQLSEVELAHQWVGGSFICSLKQRGGDFQLEAPTAGIGV